MLFPSRLTAKERANLVCKYLIQDNVVTKEGEIVSVVQPRNCNHYAIGFFTGSEDFFKEENNLRMNLPVQATTFKLLAHAIAKKTNQSPLVIEKQLLKEFRQTQVLSSSDQSYINNPAFEM